MVLEQNLSLVKQSKSPAELGSIGLLFFKILLALVITAAYRWAEPAAVSFTGSGVSADQLAGSHRLFTCFLFFYSARHIPCYADFSCTSAMCVV